MKELTERQQSIFDFINQEIQTKGYPPSVREIGKAVGLKSPASVHNHLKTLEKLNYIRRDPSKPRAIEILYGKQEIDGFSKDMLKIPLVGRVTAGEPILAEENIEDYFPLPADYLKKTDKDMFMLRVTGNSMIEAGIHDRDFVIAQQQNVANNGEIVIALLDDRATVKEFYQEKDHIRLQPRNEAYKPIRVQNPRILGKVIGLYRRFN